jgi:Flp pilus assembly protein TadG
MMTNFDASRDESGAVAIVMALCLMLFVGMLAITTDLGLLRDEKAHAQASADNAVLAAAYAWCVLEEDTDAAKTAGENVAEGNGYEDGVDGATVLITQDSEFPNRWTAVIGTSIDGIFSPAATGQTELPTGATARAECEPATTIVTPGVQLPAVYAYGECKDPEKSFTHGGDFTVVTGDLYSNQDVLWTSDDSVLNGSLHAERTLSMGGADRNKITGPITYGGTYTMKDTNTYPSLTKLSRNLTWPKTWSITDFSAIGGPARVQAESEGKYFAMGGKSLSSYMSGNVIPSGLYYSTNKVVIPASAVSAPGGVTIVTSDKIEMSGDNRNLQPYYDGLLLAAYGTAGSDDCSYKGVDTSGNNNRYSGVVYAPRAQVSYQGNGNEVVGSWIARSFYISGNNNKVTAGPADATTTTTDPTVKLLR